MEKIELYKVSVGELVEGYKNSDEEGVIGYNGRLDIRPAYQREFVYKDAQRNAVIETVKKDFPLNVMYWVKNEGEDETSVSYEVLDGQQRTISICEYVAGKYSIGDRYFNNLTKDEKAQILNYQLMVYFCDGSDSEKLAWFETINMTGAVLTKQELRNAVYTGPWLMDAKGYFSKTNCIAYNIGKDYVSGSPIRQEYLETTLDWISSGKIKDYMAKHQRDQNANELWLYFQNVINWVKVTFPKYRKEMKGLEWGALYNSYKDKQFDTKGLEAEIVRLMSDEDVSNKKGIYAYLLDGQEKHLNIRSFSPNMKREAYERQGGICVKCSAKFDIEGMEGDHITPWHSGGKTTGANCQMLCKECNRRKSGI